MTNVSAGVLVSVADVDSFESHFRRFVSNVSARVLISAADVNSFECLSLRAHNWFLSNVSARVLISAADVDSSLLHFCRMSQLACSVLLIFVEFLSSRAHFCSFLLSEVPPRLQPTKKACNQ